MRISIVIPCYNEINTISEILERVHGSPVWQTHDREIIVVDDCSNDGTSDLLKGDLKYKYDQLVLHEENSGKGFSIKSGFKVVTGDVVIIQDADLEYNPDDYTKLIDPIEKGVADVVYGSRFVGGEAHRVVYFWHMVGNRFLTLLSNILTNINLSDMETCYKAFKKEVLDKIEIKEARFGFEPEITAKIVKQKVSIYEVGISYFGRTYDEGKKIGWKDGFRAIWCIIKYNLFR